MNLITDKKALDTAINSIAGRAKKLDTDVQNVGLSAINHAQLHGDVTYINRLWLALGKGHRKAALTGWLLAFAPVVANAEPETKKERPFNFSREKANATDVGTMLANAAANPWFDFKPEAAPDVEFDVRAALIRLLKSADKAASIKEEDAGLLTELVNIRARLETPAIVDGGVDGDGEE